MINGVDGYCTPYQLRSRRRWDSINPHGAGNGMCKCRCRAQSCSPPGPPGPLSPPARAPANHQDYRPECRRRSVLTLQEIFLSQALNTT